MFCFVIGLNTRQTIKHSRKKKISDSRNCTLWPSSCPGLNDQARKSLKPFLNPPSSPVCLPIPSCRHGVDGLVWVVSPATRLQREDKVSLLGLKEGNCKGKKGASLQPGQWQVWCKPEASCALFCRYRWSRESICSYCVGLYAQTISLMRGKYE